MAKKKPVGDPGKAVAYVRVSTEEQRYGPEAQRFEIEAWAAARGVAVVAWFEERGVSGAADLKKRAGLMDAIEALRTHGAGVLVVAKRDRLARHVVKAAVIEGLVRDAGARVLSTDGVGEGDGPEEALLRTILDAFAEFERAKISARVTAGMRAKKRRGGFLGAAPIGTRPDDAGMLAEAEDEARAVERACSLRKEGCSLRAIAERLNAEGYPARGSRWHATTVARVLARAEGHMEGARA